MERNKGRVTGLKDYHQYIFQDGRLLGQFERMYRESKEVPWNQDQTVNSWWADVAVRVLELRAPYATAIDVGCGLDYFRGKFCRLCGSVVGVDVSPTAVRKPSAKFPRLEFLAFDITGRTNRLPRYDLVVEKDVFYFVFPKLDQVTRNFKELTATGGCFFLLQSFADLGRPFIGKDIIPSPEWLLQWFRHSFVLEYSCRCQEHIRAEDGPMYMALLHKREKGV